MPSISLPDSLVGTLLPPGARRDDYTEEEARNIEHAIALRFARYEERAGFHHETGEPPHRFGVHWLVEKARAAGRSTSIADGLSNRHDEFIDIIAKGDRVWVAFRVTGVHSGELWGHPATGREVSFFELGVYRFVDGKIAEAWYLGDEYELVQQLSGEPR